jgi:hypothetical protein
MANNIIIYSTAPARSAASCRSNRSFIYKLYRATRCGSDTDIDPRGHTNSLSTTPGSGRSLRARRSS